MPKKMTEDEVAETTNGEATENGETGTEETAVEAQEGGEENAAADAPAEETGAAAVEASADGEGDKKAGPKKHQLLILFLRLPRALPAQLPVR
jgi:hypothetical protein